MDPLFFHDLVRIAPAAVIILSIVYAGYFYGRASQQPFIDALKEWINELRGK
jgi:hypothetical protein